MTTRTIRCLGYGFGNTPATIIVKANAVTIFEGEITTTTVAELPQGNPYDQWANNVVSLYTFTSTVGVEESVSTTIEVTGGILLLANYTANYSSIPGIGSEAPTSSGPDTYLTLGGEVRQNVTIDGIAQVYHPAGSETELGTWWWQVGTGSTVAFNMLINAGLE